MKYLPFVERSNARLGYVKPEYAPKLAILMEEHEGQHPHQIARVFRQTGTPLSKETKKQLGIRANAAMTGEALDALSQRGLSEPLKGLEVTLLDASFAYFRHRSVASITGSGIEEYATFRISRAWPDCAGCDRLDGAAIGPHELNTLPPDDCGREACALGVSPNVNYTKIGIDKYTRRISETPPKKRSWLSRLFCPT